jgi:N-acetylglucosaminyldiphosphoundecaprenol N-acetyl-beta-D-mannosaminyltransferase
LLFANDEAESYDADELRVKRATPASGVVLEVSNGVILMSAVMTRTGATAIWPRKYDLFGVQVSAVTCDEAVECIMRAASQREPAIVSAFSVHALIEASSSPESMENANRFAMITPDGQPVRWSLNWLYGAGLKRTVRGADLMWKLCERASIEGVPIYLYGSTERTLAALEANLQKAFPDLIIAGAESPPFRALSLEEDNEMVDRVNESGAGIMFLGLGCPKQDHFAAEHADCLLPVQLCIGAAFDFLAGTKPIAPEWMQLSGLEWVFRLMKEPRRLWKRYLVTNSVFLAKLASRFLHRHRRRLPS